MEIITALGNLPEEGVIEEVFATAVNINTNGKFTAKQLRFYSGTVFNGEPLGDVDYTDFFYPGDQVKFSAKIKERDFSITWVTEVIIIQRKATESHYLEGTGIVVWSETGFGIVRGLSGEDIFMPWLACYPYPEKLAIDDLMPPGTVILYRATAADQRPRTNREKCNIKAVSVRKIEGATAYDCCRSGTGHAKFIGRRRAIIVSNEFGDIGMLNSFAKKIGLSRTSVIPVRFAIVPVGPYAAETAKYQWDAVQVERLDTADCDCRQNNVTSSSPAEFQPQVWTSGFSTRKPAPPQLPLQIPPPKVEVAPQAICTDEELIQDLANVHMRLDDDSPPIPTPIVPTPTPSAAGFSSLLPTSDKLQNQILRNRFIASKFKQKDLRLADGVTLLQKLLEDGNNNKNAQVLFKVANRCPKLMQTALEWQGF